MIFREKAYTQVTLEHFIFSLKVKLVLMREILIIVAPLKEMNF